MITRIVRMTFSPSRVAEFLEVFEASKHRIAAFPGCQRLELLHQTDAPNVYYTLSRWESEAALNAYRNSELFRSTWAQTKVLFADRAQAWSLVGVFDSAVL